MLGTKQLVKRKSLIRGRLTCAYCGKKFAGPQSRKEGADNFCSTACYADAIINGMPPKSVFEYRGRNWAIQSRAARERDNYTCQHCGKFPVYHVHHITPYRLYGILRYQEANRLENLITLCPSCHCKTDQAYRKAEKNA